MQSWRHWLDVQRWWIVVAFLHRRPWIRSIICAHWVDSKFNFSGGHLTKLCEYQIKLLLLEEVYKLESLTFISIFLDTMMSPWSVHIYIDDNGRDSWSRQKMYWMLFTPPPKERPAPARLAQDAICDVWKWPKGRLEIFFRKSPLIPSSRPITISSQTCLSIPLFETCPSLISNNLSNKIDRVLVWWFNVPVRLTYLRGECAYTVKWYRCGYLRPYFIFGIYFTIMIQVTRHFMT